MNQTEIVQRLRVGWYRRRWTCEHVDGTPQVVVPVVLAGAGSVRFDRDVTIGWQHSLAFLSGYTYIGARHSRSRVALGEGTQT
jgi:hypothetical protein